MTRIEYRPFHVQKGEMELNESWLPFLLWPFWLKIHPLVQLLREISFLILCSHPVSTNATRELYSSSAIRQATAWSGPKPDQMWTRLHLLRDFSQFLIPSCLMHVALSPSSISHSRSLQWSLWVALKPIECSSKGPYLHELDPFWITRSCNSAKTCCVLHQSLSCWLHGP